MTTASPRNIGSDPRTSSTATISPHAAIGTGFFATARSDVTMASAALAWRSSIRGNETTLTQSATTANRNPTPQPTTISHHPCGVVSTRRAKSGMDAAAQLIESQRREWPKQGEAGGQRKQQRQHGIAEHHARQHQAEHRIDHAEDDGVAWHRLEIFPTEPKRLVQVGQADGPDDGRSRVVLGAVLRRFSRGRDIAGVWCGHGRYLPCRGGRISRRSSAQAAFLGNDHDQARREDRKPKLAMSRTEPSAYLESAMLSLTLR